MRSSPLSTFVALLQLGITALEDDDDSNVTLVRQKEVLRLQLLAAAASSKVNAVGRLLW